MHSLNTIVLVITATATALIAGLFYSWTCSISPGLSRLGDKEYLRAMQAINEAILNPLFFASFMGTLLLLPVSTFLQGREAISVRFWLLLAASVIYAVGVFGVTMAGNVPMNDAIAGLQLDTAPPEELAARRGQFEGPWTTLNNIRTLASAISIVLVIIACLSRQEAAAE